MSYTKTCENIIHYKHPPYHTSKAAYNGWSLLQTYTQKSIMDKHDDQFGQKHVPNNVDTWISHNCNNSY